MKKILSIAYFILLSTCTFAQTEKQNTLDVGNSKLDTICKSIEIILDQIADIRTKTVVKERYKIYPTQNIYTFLKLDTRTGRIYQIQWNLDSDKEFAVVLNDQDLSYGTDIANFELIPTQNMYQFIMLEKTTGTVYHVQWGTEPLKRWVRIISDL